MSVFEVTADGARWRGVDRGEVLSAAALLFAPGSAHELRSLPPGRSRLVLADRPEGVVDAADALSDGARGLYYTLNPVRPDLGDRAARNSDVLARRWLLVDVDPAKAEPDSSATEGEKTRAWEVACALLGDLLARGWPEPIVVDSGNGYHLLWRVDLPNDAASARLVAGVLKALAAAHDTDAAKVDTKVHNAARIAKLPGTVARKGLDTPDRPHRPCRVVAAPGDPQPVPAGLLADLAGAPTASPQAGPASPFAVEAADGGGRESAYVRSAFLQELARVAMAPEGARNDALNHAAFKIGTLLGSGGLTRGEAETQLVVAAGRAGLGEAEAVRTVRSGLDAGAAQPRAVPEKPVGPGEPEAAAAVTQEGPDATVADLRVLQSRTSWVYPGWIPNAALTLLAAEAGTGKTRFCFDLHRRSVFGLPWPDGTAMTLPPYGKALWVVADNQWQEMCDIAEGFGIPDELVVLNAPASDPYDGTSLQTPEELAAFEARVRRVRPALVFIDTITNTGDFKSQDSSDAKRQYKPLQEIATRCQVPIVCVTHLNAGGKVLGRRAVEKVRVVIQIECPDPEGQPTRRKLWVSKSKAVRPPALGVTMGDGGNEYDLSPPEPPAPARHNGATTGPAPVKTTECMDWLAARLAAGATRVSRLRNEAEQAGFSAKTLYQARDRLGVLETERDRYKFWEAPPAANGHHNGHNGAPF